MIVTKNLNKSYDKVNVLKGINVEIKDGTICLLLGPSGSGKTTFLNLIGCIEDIKSGEVFINDTNISSLTNKELTLYRRNNIGYVFQFYNLIPNLTARENIEVGSYLSKEPLDIEELIDLLDLRDSEFKMPNELSGGLCQRVSLARAIIKNPKLLLCDEPTGALDFASSKEVLKLLVKVNKKYNTSIIIVSHNEAIKYISDQIIRLRDGVVSENKINDEIKDVDDIWW